MLNAPFCPIKQKLRKKQSEVSMVKIPQHKVTKFNKFFSGSFFVFFEQSDRTIFIAADCFEFCKSVEKFEEEYRSDRYFGKLNSMGLTQKFIREILNFRWLC